MNDEPRSTIDRLVDRVATGEADAQEWSHFEQHAATDRELWERVVRAARAELRLRADFEQVQRLVERVALPASVERPRAVGRAATRPWLALTGWAAAAVLAVLLARSPAGPRNPADSLGATPGPVASSSAEPKDATTPETEGDDAEDPSTPLWTEIQRGPRVVLQTRPGPTAQEVEVWTLCTTVEHAVVDRLFQFAHDDAGEATTVPVSPLAFAGPERL